MNEDESLDRFSTPFLIAWLLLPGLAFFLSLFYLREVSAMASVTLAALILAGGFFPLELEKRGRRAAIRILSLLLYLCPFLLVAGRLEQGNWRQLALLGLVGFWLGFVDSVWELGRHFKNRLIGHYYFVFLLFGLGGPLVGYLFRDFGNGQEWMIKVADVAEGLSPFDLVFRLSQGRDFGQGALMVALLFFLSLTLRKRFVEEPR